MTTRPLPERDSAAPAVFQRFTPCERVRTDLAVWLGLPAQTRERVRRIKEQQRNDERLARYQRRRRAYLEQTGDHEETAT